MQMIVYGSLEQAKRGGVPGVTNLVNAYLNVKFPQPYVGYEVTKKINISFAGNFFTRFCLYWEKICSTFKDGTTDGHPIWSFIYYCLRAGDVRAALVACESGAPTVAEFGAALRETLSTDCPKLESDFLFFLFSLEFFCDSQAVEGY